MPLRGNKHPFLSTSTSPHHKNKSVSRSAFQTAYFSPFLDAKQQVSSPALAVSCHLLNVAGNRRGLFPKQRLISSRSSTGCSWHPQFCCVLFLALCVVFLSCQASDSFSLGPPDYFSIPKNSLIYVNKVKADIFLSHSFSS